MPKKKTSQVSGADSWRVIAMGYPETEATPSCNKTAFKARKKSFLFLGEEVDSYNVMVKLGDSRPEAEALAAESPEKVSVGPHWITAEFTEDELLPSEMVQRWGDESFRLVAPKTLIKKLDS